MKSGIMGVPIEDFVEDIVGKVLRGRGIDLQTVAREAEISVSELQALLRGEETSSEVVRAAAGPLGLDPDALAASARKTWYPKEVGIEGLATFTTSYKDMLVNAFLVWDPATGKCAVFDTGTDASEMIDLIEEKNLELETIFLTHTHPDHIADLDTLRERFPSIPVLVNRLEPVEGASLIDAGFESEIGQLRVTSFHTHGHSAGGTTWFVEGLEHPLAVVGDALFAGSMGGGVLSFADALATNRKYLFTLPDETIVCPGHGPNTSIAEEKAHNPFYPEFK